MILNNQVGPDESLMVLLIILFIVSFLIFIVILINLKKCPSDKLLVIISKNKQNTDNPNSNYKYLRGGVKFVWPFIQTYYYLDLKPVVLSLDQFSFNSKLDERIALEGKFTFAISTQKTIVENAITHLLNLSQEDITSKVKTIFLDLMNNYITSTRFEVLVSSIDKFRAQTYQSFESSLSDIGIRLLTYNITKINQ